MLGFYHRVAVWLAPRRVWLYALAAGSLVAFVGAVALSDPGNEAIAAFTALTVFLWSVLLLLIVDRFQAGLPLPADGAGLWRRLVLRMQRAILHLLALLVTVLFCCAIWFTARALGGW